MGPIDALAHLLGLVMPALLTGALAAAGAKLLWRKEFSHRPWRRLMLWPMGCGAAALIGGLVLFGRDGRMLSYAAMVVACALPLWWLGFVRPRA